MTLKRQLLLGILILFLLVFAGLQTMSIFAVRDFLQQQLSSQAQDTATALSRSLEVAMAKEDKVLAEIQISTMFDRGYYKKILVLDASGNKLAVKEMVRESGKVPLWFGRAFPLETAPGEAFISTGWRQLGKVLVMVQPTFAYEFLWRSVWEIVFWMIAMYAIALLLTILLLRVILKPLLSIEKVALDIQEKQFNQIAIIPKARELSRVVIAMNSMSRRISEILEAELEKAESYRRVAYTDRVTGLENRLGFDLRFNLLLEDAGDYTAAALVVLEIDALKEFNIQFGYREGDAILLASANMLAKVFESYLRISSRIGGTSLAVVVTACDESQLRICLKRVQVEFEELLIAHQANKCLSYSMGCVIFNASKTRGEIFSAIDLALETARQEGRGKFALLNIDRDQVGAGGSLEWRLLLQNALVEKRWSLFAQAVRNLKDGEIIHHEIFVRLLDAEGALISARDFLPMALRHCLMPEVDSAIVTLIFELFENRGSSLSHVAVNLSVQAIENEAFCTLLFDELRKRQRVGKRLSVELSEFSCAKNMVNTQKFVSQLRALGAGFGIDNFGLGTYSLQLLRQIPPDYIKIDGGIIREISINDSALSHLKAVVGLAKTLDAAVIAQCVESQVCVDFLLRNDVFGGQGYFLDVPESAEIKLHL